MNTRTDELFSLYEAHLAKLGRSEASIKDYCINLRAFYTWFQKINKRKKVSITRVKENNLLLYRGYLQHGKRYKTTTINQHIASIRNFFTFLQNKGAIKESVIVNLKPLSKPYLRAPDLPNKKQISKLFRMVNTNNDRGKRDFAILQLFTQCGLKLSEVANVKIIDIDVKGQQGTLKIGVRKENLMRHISLNKPVSQSIKAYLRVRPNLSGIKKLFISQLNKPLSSRSISHIVKKYSESAGMPELSSYDLRHYAASNLYDSHKDICAVQKALGHKTLESTRRYKIMGKK